MRNYRNGTFEFKKVVLLALLTIQAVLLLSIEAWVPFYIGVPGVKPGLVNVIVISTLTFFSLSETLTVVLISCVISFVIRGGPISFMFSLIGGILSILAMWLVLKALGKWLGMVGIGIVGAIVHNISQALAACLVLSDLSVTGYVRELILSGIIMGCLVGICSSILVNTLKRFNLISNF